MSEELLERIEREPGTEVRASVIWLHGLGDTGHGWSMVPPELGVQEELGPPYLHQSCLDSGHTHSVTPLSRALEP